jgi:hypothetical protein
MNMKWIKGRNQFLTEAKIRDVINPKQKEIVIKRWGKKYLDYEEVEPNSEIKTIQGNWKLEPEQKYKVLDLFFRTDVRKAEQTFDNLPTEFVRTVSDALNWALELDDPSLTTCYLELTLRQPFLINRWLEMISVCLRKVKMDNFNTKIRL